jgi:hypothetical protein
MLLTDPAQFSTIWRMIGVQLTLVHRSTFARSMCLPIFSHKLNDGDVLTYAVAHPVTRSRSCLLFLVILPRCCVLAYDRRAIDFGSSFYFCTVNVFADLLAQVKRR